MDRSKKDSSRDDTCHMFRHECQLDDDWLTVSQVRHRVSLVSTPSNSLCTRVASWGAVPEFELVVPVTIVGETNVPTELDTNDSL